MSHINAKLMPSCELLVKSVHELHNQIFVDPACDVEGSLLQLAMGGLQASWSVADVRFDTKEIHFEIRFKPGTRFACPPCGVADQPVHDTRSRSWEHLRFFEHKAFIHAQVPRVACSQCSKTGQISAPWARSGSGFSQLFDAFVIALAKEMPVRAIADLLEIGDDRLWRVLDHHVPAAHALEDFSDVTVVGIDETAARRSKLAPLKKFALTLKTHWDGALLHGA
jgi:transposase